MKPVNKLSDVNRDGVIAQDYPLLRDDLMNLMPDRSIPLVSIEANVCRILEPKLTKDGFNVLNGGRVIYFPVAGGGRSLNNSLVPSLKLLEIETARW